MLEAIHLSKTYKDGDETIYALKNVSLSLPSKGLVFIVGKSGSGKSTLLNLLGGLDSPTDGKILFKGADISETVDRDKYRAETVSFCFQKANLLIELSAEENVVFGSGQIDGEKLDSILASLGIANLKKRKAASLSGGQAQRVALARALYRDSPPIALR